MFVNFSKNIYNQFLKRTGTKSVPISHTDKKEPQKNIASIKVSDIQTDNNHNHSKKKIFGIIGLSVGTVALLTIIALFALPKGFSASFAKKFSKVTEQIKNTIAELSNRPKNLTFTEKIKLQTNKALQPVAEFMEASSNITAIKDSVTNKILKKLKMEPAVNKINTFFKDNIVLKTKNNAYHSAELSVVEFSNYLEKLAKKENNPELLNKTKEFIDTYMKDFSLKNHVSRSDKNWNQMNGLSDKVYNHLFKGEEHLLKKFNKLKSYVTMDATAKERELLKTELIKGQKAFNEKLDEIFNILPEEQIEIAKKYAQKSQRRLSKAIESEIKAFNKLAEIQVGSVSTDILGIIIPSTLAMGLVINSEDNHERIGTTLTKGIPILGGLGVSYYGSTRGFTGSKNFILGLTTAYILNILGTKAKESYQKYTERQTVLQKAFDSFTKMQNKEI